jgi:hypothetical protein
MPDKPISICSQGQLSKLDKYCEKESCIKAMMDEYSNLDKRKCWRPNTLPPNQKLANTIMVIRIVRLPNGEMKKMEGRIVIAAQNFKPGEDHQLDCFAATAAVCSVREEINVCIQEDRECKSTDIGQAFTRCKRDRALFTRAPPGTERCFAPDGEELFYAYEYCTAHYGPQSFPRHSGPLRSTTSSWIAVSDSAVRQSTACTSKNSTEPSFVTVSTSTTCYALTHSSSC